MEMGLDLAKLNGNLPRIFVDTSHAQSLLRCIQKICMLIDSDQRSLLVLLFDTHYATKA